MSREECAELEQIAMKNYLAAGLNYGRLKIRASDEGSPIELGLLMAGLNLRLAAEAYARAVGLLTSAILDECTR